MSHTCHHPTCNRKVPPKLLACAPHWHALPKELQTDIWKHYVPGQEVLKNPTEAYLEVMDKCIAWWKANP